MKLELPEIQIEKSGSFKTQQFAFGDERVIMEILRSKMYSNPIKTICQEIASNARDAHREAGHNEPIVVKLPTTFDKSFYIKDYGIGITPDRMANVFIKYGNSTKRSDNIQTGGFGLGAKSPFSYTDTFTVITITKEDNVNIKREYVAFIDETGIGSMSLLKEEQTEDRTGTTIMITPRTGDEYKFKEYIYDVCQYWTVKPEVICDGEVEWPNNEILFSGNGWSILSGTGNPVALIDEIPYSIDNLPQESVKADQIESLKNLPVLIYAKTGELKPTAQRDSIDFQPDAITFIYDKFRDIIVNLNTIISSKLDVFDNAWEARLFFNKNFSNWPISPIWKGKKLSKKFKINRDHVVAIHRFSSNHQNRMSRHLLNVYYDNDNGGCYNYEIQVNTSSKILELDQINPPNNSFVGKLIKHLGCDELYLVQFKDGCKPTDFTFPTLTAAKATMPKSIPPVRVGGSNTPKLMWVDNGPKREWNSEPIDYKATGYYVPTVHGKVIFNDKAGTPIPFDLDDIKGLKSHLNINIALIPKQYTAKLESGWANAFTYAFNLLDKLKAELPTEIESYEDEISDHISYSLLKLFKKYKSRLSKDNLIYQWMEQSNLHNTVKEQYDKKLAEVSNLAYYLKVKQDFDAKIISKSLKKFKTDYNEKYPLLDIIQSGYSEYSHEKRKYRNEIFRYIISKDKKDKLNQENINVVSTPHQNTEVIDNNLDGQQTSNNPVEQLTV